MEFRNIRAICLLLALIAPTSAPAAEATATRPVATVQDAIAMTRIQRYAAPDEAAVAISPDGNKAVIVTWRGDLARNTNVYTLMLLDIGKDRATHRTPIALVSKDFAGDTKDQKASPFTQLRFLSDNRTIVYLGRDGRNVAQVFRIDSLSGEIAQLTDSATAVRLFAVDGDGKLIGFSAAVPAEDGATAARMAIDGVFVADPKMFPLQTNYLSPFPLLWDAQQGRLTRRSYITPNATPQLVFDSRQGRSANPPDLSDPLVAASDTLSLADDEALDRSSFDADPAGRYILMFPYGLTDHDMHVERYAHYRSHDENAFSRTVAAPYGLVNAQTGQIERLIDAPHPQYHPDWGTALWTPDGRSVIIFTLFPDAPDAPPAWVEVEIATRKMTPLGLPKGWKPVSWSDRGKTLIVRDSGQKFGTLHRQAINQWDRLQIIGSAPEFAKDWPVATNGHVVVGVRQGRYNPPEIATYDLKNRRVSTLTDFNPQLRQRTYGEVSLFTWPNGTQQGSGFLIKPVGYESGQRYPLVILQDDGTLGRSGEPFLLDASLQLSGHAIQMLAAKGFMVLYPREPDDLGATIETPEEGVSIVAYLGSAIRQLDREGLIDPKRVGLSGWSRAGYHTAYMAIHAPATIAAAAIIDGGSDEYNEGSRPFFDDELRRIRAPILFQPHGLPSLVDNADMADRMAALGRPMDILYFANASHETTQPQHRLRSLQTNIDWFRFWLRGEEDPQSINADQYARWRKLREMQSKAANADQLSAVSTNGPD